VRASAAVDRSAGFRNSYTKSVGLWQRDVVASVVDLIDEVNQHWARLVLGWAIGFGQVNHLGM